MTPTYSANSNRLGLLLPLTLLVAASAALFGCGADDEVRGRISGKVTFQGQPVSEGLVLFSSNERGINMNATLKPDGSYEIIMAKGAGLPLGTYKVCVSPPPMFFPIGASSPPKVKEYPNIPKKYRKFLTSGLTVTIEEGDNPFDIDMQP